MATQRQTLRPLSEYTNPAGRPSWATAGLLLCGALLLVIATPLAWEHHDIPARGFRIVYGMEAAPWAIAYAVVALACSARLFVAEPGVRMKVILGALVFLLTLAMFAHFVDVRQRAYYIGLQPWVGPGFVLALLGIGAVLLGSARAWLRA